uniref:Lipocalin domain-containing protein n=1 Tax=Meloidogyne floridensis TaxID=298350 RepID=A0A915NBP1_9BILA
LIKQVNADQVAEKLQRNLYVAVDDLDVEKMTGKWYTMIYDPRVEQDQCIRTECKLASLFVNPENFKVKLLDQSPNFASFSTIRHSIRASDGSIRISHGIGRKYGPDPFSMLITMGQANEPCPYFPVKVGQSLSDKNENYKYLVLTQALKQPTIVLARDPEEFNIQYREEVLDYLTRFGYWKNPLIGTELLNTDWSRCNKQELFYGQIEEDENEKIEGIKRIERGGLLNQLEGKEKRK